MRHYTKLKEIADKYGCDSSGCNTNGALLDRIYESPVSPVDPTGQIDAKIDIQNITARAVRPVEGHSYMGQITFPSDSWLLELDNVVGYKHSDMVFYTPVLSSGVIAGVNCIVIFNDVENSNFGNLLLVINSESGGVGFTDEQIETIKGQLPITFTPNLNQGITGFYKLTITEVISGGENQS